MGDVSGENYAEVKEELGILVGGLFEQAGLPVPEKGTIPGKFREFLVSAAKKSPTGQIVVLIDEYDEPIAAFLDDLKTLKRVRKLLHDFYEKLKFSSDSIRFLMMTGVTKLTKLSVFSGLNHLKDRSMDERFATLLGYTPDELDGALRENVEVFGEKNGMDFKAAKAALLSWYDGYRFSPRSEARVCNPVSLGSALESGELKGYWETTGRTTLVINCMANAGKLPADLENVPARPLTLDVCDAETLPMVSLLYQGGYLTIKDVKKGDPTKDETDSYVLAPPNLEVREALFEGYLSQAMGLDEDPFNTLVDKAKQQIDSGDIADVVETMLFSLYAQIPPDWRIKDEAEAKRYFQLFFAMLGANPAPEFPSARGYADKWIGGARPVTLIGINFNLKKRNIDIPVVEPA